MMSPRDVRSYTRKYNLSYLYRNLMFHNFQILDIWTTVIELKWKLGNFCQKPLTQCIDLEAKIKILGK